VGPTGFLPQSWPSGWKEIECERVGSGERVTLGYVGAGSAGDASEPDPNSLDFVLPVTVDHFAGGTVDLIPRGRPNRPGTKLDGPRYITIHDTDNAGKGAGAASHARYLKRTTDDGPATSWHFTVDDQGVYQHLPLDEVAWHAGDGHTPGGGNRASLGIKICENSDGDRAKAEDRAAWLTARLLARFSLGLEKVAPHQHWYPEKSCPHILPHRPGGWDAFLRDVRSRLQDPLSGPSRGLASSGGHVAKPTLVGVDPGVGFAVELPAPQPDGAWDQSATVFLGEKAAVFSVPGSLRWCVAVRHFDVTAARRSRRSRWRPLPNSWSGQADTTGRWKATT
jgi:N-acetylmuramoyl-L-alanine amidase